MQLGQHPTGCDLAHSCAEPQHGRGWLRRLVISLRPGDKRCGTFLFFPMDLLVSDLRECEGSVLCCVLSEFNLEVFSAALFFHPPL